MTPKYRKIIICFVSALILAIAVFNILKLGKGSQLGNSKHLQEEADTRDGAGSLAARLLAKRLYLSGLNLYGLRQFGPAIERLELSVALDPSYQAAGIKLASAKKKMFDLIESDYSLGLSEFRSLHYDRAIQAWRRVQQLQGGVDSELYKRAEKNIGLAEGLKEN